MNARTSRLLRRVAYAMRLNDPKDTQAEAGVKKAWNRTPRNKRGELRPALVHTFNIMMEHLNGNP